MGACESNRQLLTAKIDKLKCNAEKIKYYLSFTLETELKNKKKCRDTWIECLKKREERKNKVQQEMNSAFIPCFVKKKADEFLDCLKCYRWTTACVLYKKQEVVLAENIKKLVKKQLALVSDDVKQAEIYLETFNEIKRKKIR